MCFSRALSASLTGGRYRETLLKSSSMTLVVITPLTTLTISMHLRKRSEAVKWLKETAATGFPNYPLFARDQVLDRIRQAPEVVQFMAEQKAQWEKYRQEFGC